MQPVFPSPVPTWHDRPYAAISPQRAELNSAGRTVIITGAGTGIGRETALAFAAAGASRLVLIGRTDATLAQTKESVQASSNETTCVAFRADVRDEKAMQHIAVEVGIWDVFILNAGHLPTPASIASSNLSDYWEAYETNVKSVIITATAFLPTANKTHATMLGVTAGALFFPPGSTPGLSGYLTSKLAMVKVLEFLAAENPNIFLASIHPGMVDTEVFRKSGAKPEMFHMDSASLSAHFMLWLSSSEAAFLRGKLLWANWDVEELKAVGQKIQEGSQMTIGVNGWPFENIL